MDLFHPQLFLGFPVDEACSQQLKMQNKSILDTFLSEGDTYLKQLNSNGVEYIGKFVGEISDLESLELLEKNIYSLLRRILPDYEFKKRPLILLTISNHD